MKLLLNTKMQLTMTILYISLDSISKEGRNMYTGRAFHLPPDLLVHDVIQVGKRWLLGQHVCFYTGSGRVRNNSSGSPWNIQYKKSRDATSLRRCRGSRCDETSSSIITCVFWGICSNWPLMIFNAILKIRSWMLS